jgi:hypothetical protein
MPQVQNGLDYKSVDYESSCAELGLMDLWIAG